MESEFFAMHPNQLRSFSEHSWKCLVTGVTGFLGRYIAQHLVDRGHDVTGLTRRATDFPQTTVADICQPFELDGTSFDAVVHVAGKAHSVPRTEAEREEFFQVNQHGTQNLLHALERLPQPPRYFGLISTIAVYGKEEGERLPETTPTEPTTAYGQSKLAAERLVTEWCVSRNCQATILRLPLVAGRDAPGNLRAMIQALRAGHYIGIGRGEARRSVVRACDVAEVLPRIMEVGGLYHLTDGHHPSLMELETAMCRELKRSRPWRMPIGIARMAGWSGDLAQRLTGRRCPINSDRVAKLTHTYTVSDEAIRRHIDWNPGRVIDHIQELLD